MRVGVPSEIKDNEHRIALTPASVAEPFHHGHHLLVERGAGRGVGEAAAEYRAAGAAQLEGGGVAA